MIDRCLSIQEIQIARQMWKQGKDTLDIARALNVCEHRVANEMDFIRTNEKRAA